MHVGGDGARWKEGDGEKWRKGGRVREEGRDEEVAAPHPLLMPLAHD